MEASAYLGDIAHTGHNTGAEAAATACYDRRQQDQRHGRLGQLYTQHNVHKTGKHSSWK